MKHNILTISAVCLCLASACSNDSKILCYGKHDKTEGDITAYGAVGNGVLNCSKEINNAIAALPAEGGVLVVPAGDFTLDAPIVIDRDNVTIMGMNPGMRSNIDVNGINDLLGPGGGSKLIARKAPAAIVVEKGVKGTRIMDLMVSGGTETRNTGILFNGATGATEESTLSNIIAINLTCGFEINNAKNLNIENCWVCELTNGISLTGGNGINVRNCQLGAQPKGVTFKADKVENLYVYGTHIYPDGHENMVLTNCSNAIIESNNFKSNYNGIFVLTGNGNKIIKNIFWLTGDAADLQYDHGADYGVIRIGGDNNEFVNNNISCKWLYPEAVTVNAEGSGNSFRNCLIDNVESSRVFWVSQGTEVSNCVANEKITIK